MNTVLIRLDAANWFNWRLTPWDAKVFGINTLEILDFNCSGVNQGRLLIAELEKIVKVNRIEFAYVRIPSDERLARQLFYENGFYLAEISLELGKKDLPRYNLNFPKVELLPLGSANEQTIEAVKNIARDSFDFGRFHDDILIDPQTARLRYYNWVDDMLGQKIEAYYIKHKDEVVGFHFQRSQGEIADLILTGCKKGSSTLAIPLWHSVFESLKERGIKECKTMISASNAPIVNLYTMFQFKVTRSFFGLHKTYDCEYSI